MLNEANEAEVIARYKAGETARQLGRAYGVHPNRIYRLLDRNDVPRRPRGRRSNHYQPTAHLREVIDGLMLGDGHLFVGPRHRTPLAYLIQQPEHISWLKLVAAEFTRAGIESRIRKCRGGTVVLKTRCYREFEAEYARWYPHGELRLPADVRLSPVTLMHWFAGRGSRGSNGYSVRLTVRLLPREDVEELARRLRELYGFKPRVFAYAHDNGSGSGSRYGLRLSRPGDRLGLRRLIVSTLPACFQHRLVLEESSMTEEEAERRRSPWVADEAKAALVRAHAATGATYRNIGALVGLEDSLVGRIVRAERWRQAAEQGGIRRRRPNIKITPEILRDIAARLAAGATQAAAGAPHGLRQSRVSWLIRNGKLPASADPVR